MRKLCGAVSRVDYFPRVLEVTVSIGQFDKSFITLAAEVSRKDLRHLFNDMLCWVVRTFVTQRTKRGQRLSS